MRRHAVGPPAGPQLVHFHSCPSLLQLGGAVGQPRQIQGQDPRGLPAFRFFRRELWNEAPLAGIELTQSLMTLLVKQWILSFLSQTDVYVVAPLLLLFILFGIVFLPLFLYS